MSRLICRVIESEQELQRCFEIRKTVFLEEQKIFEESDVDDYDRMAIHIVAIQEGEIVGTVRVYHEGNGTWYGGRLAVLQAYRGKETGSHLIQKAVELVKEQKGKRFCAYIQDKNVPYFERCGWRSVSEVQKYGIPHQLMEMPV